MKSNALNPLDQINSNLYTISIIWPIKIILKIVLLFIVSMLKKNRFLYRIITDPKSEFYETAIRKKYLTMLCIWCDLNGAIYHNSALLRRSSSSTSWKRRDPDIVPPDYYIYFSRSKIFQSIQEGGTFCYRGACLAYIRDRHSYRQAMLWKWNLPFNLFGNKRLFSLI